MLSAQLQKEIERNAFLEDKLDKLQTEHITLLKEHTELLITYSKKLLEERGYEPGYNFLRPLKGGQKIK